jgi:hypothetical protein
MRGLLVLVVAMGVLILAGTATLGVLIVKRMGGAAPAAFDVVLDQPPGSRIAGIAAWADHLAVSLSGGGADRVVVLDARTGRPVGQVRLPQ